MKHRSLALIFSLSAGLILFACSEEKKTAPQKPNAAKPKAQPSTQAADTKPPAEKLAAASGATGQLSGSVRFEGTAPVDNKIDMSSQPECVKIADDAMGNEYRIKDGKIQDVFVYVKNPPKNKYPIPSEPVLLDQKGCRYSPKVFGIMAKQKLQILNSDPMMHNIHPSGKNSFNLAMPKQGMKIEKKLKKEQVLTPIKCDVHPWMKAYAGVVKHPFFAVTDENGAFEIKNIPIGDYQLIAVHGALGSKSIEITVGEDAAVKANFEFSGK